MPAEYALIVEDLHKSFGSINVLKGISLKVKEGDVISMIGSSGSGKSTFLRCINLLEIPDSGKVTIGNDLIRMKKTDVEKPSRPIPNRWTASGRAWAWCFSISTCGRT